MNQNNTCPLNAIDNYNILAFGSAIENIPYFHVRLDQSVNPDKLQKAVREALIKAVKLDKFVAIANALDVSADRLLVDVVTRSVDGVANELSQAIKKFPPDEQKRIIKAVRAYVED